MIEAATKRPTVRPMNLTAIMISFQPSALFEARSSQKEEQNRGVRS